MLLCWLINFTAVWLWDQRRGPGSLKKLALEAVVGGTAGVGRVRNSASGHKCTSPQRNSIQVLHLSFSFQDMLCVFSGILESSDHSCLRNCYRRECISRGKAEGVVFFGSFSFPSPFIRKENRAANWPGLLLCLFQQLKTCIISQVQVWGHYITCKWPQSEPAVKIARLLKVFAVLKIRYQNNSKSSFETHVIPVSDPKVCRRVPSIFASF